MGEEGVRSREQRGSCYTWDLNTPDQLSLPDLGRLSGSCPEEEGFEGEEECKQVQRGQPF